MTVVDAKVLPEPVLDGFEQALREFARTLTANFASLTGAAPEDQLKGPVSDLLAAAGKALGVVVVSRTEVKVEGLGGRPDVGVDADGLPIGNVELKAPGKGARPANFADKRSRDQWEKFKALPNLVYTDGREWALYRSGETTVGPFALSSDPTTAGPEAITRDDAVRLLGLLGGLLGWSPAVPSSPRALAAMLAPLTRVLRDEVLVDVRNKGVMATLADEWRATLFPDADDPAFADGYAQTFTYALLLARLEGAQPPLTAETAANALDAEHALLAQALRVLGQQGTREAIGMPVGLLERLIGAVDPVKVAKGRDPWLYFYEDFLAAYDPVQRNNRGVYYTPLGVVEGQTRLAEWVLTHRFGMKLGYASEGVIVLDPAAGTGTYPIAVIRSALDAAEKRGGPGIVAEVAADLGARVRAFELLVGPYAVAHLRLSRLLSDAGAVLSADGVGVYLTDTLAAPQHAGFAAQATLFQKKLAAEQERASRIKSDDTTVTVVIGNPPYDRDESQAGKGVRRKGGMVRYDVETGGPGLIKDFLQPLIDAGRGVEAKTIYNDYVYFWRWAIWKVCEQNDSPAVVSYITPSSYLTGPGFAGMRELVRRRFDELWLLDLGGEGRGTRKEDNVFSGVLTPVVIATAVKLPRVDPAKRVDTPAVVHYKRIHGTQAEKLAALAAIEELDAEAGWSTASDGWGAPFVPAGTGEFDTWPALDGLLPWRDTGTHFYRSWPIAESRDVLQTRWTSLMDADSEARGALLRESRDRKASRKYKDVRTGAVLPALESLAADTAPPKAEPLSFRSFDRQWCFPDNRLGDYIRPQLWMAAGPRQVFLQTLVQSPIGAGPALVAHAFVPDCHAFRGSFGDKGVFPVWRDAAATSANVTPGLLEHLSAAYGQQVSAEDLVAYIYALLGTDAYTQRYAHELAASPARVPFTADGELFARVAKFGRDLLWWATYGERFTTKDSPDTLPAGSTKNTVSVPGTPAGYPQQFGYDPLTCTLTVGDGKFEPVAPEVWSFQVSGLRVVESWLSYRMRKRAGKSSSDLDKVRPENWTFSRELLDLLTVVEHIVVATPEAGELLDEVVAGDLLEPADLPAPSVGDRQPPRRDKATGGQAALFA